MNYEVLETEAHVREVAQAAPVATPPAGPSSSPARRYTFAFDRWLPTAESNEFVWA